MSALPKERAESYLPMSISLRNFDIYYRRFIRKYYFKQIRVQGCSSFFGIKNVHSFNTQLPNFSLIRNFK